MEKMVKIQSKELSILVTGKTEAEILEKAKAELIKALEESRLGYLYGLSDADSLSFSNCLPGLIVEGNKGDVGIVTAVNKKTVNVTYSNGISVQGPPSCFKKSDKDFETARNKKFSPFNIFEGDSGYMEIQGKVVPCVIGKINSGVCNVFLVEKPGSYIKARTENVLKGLVREPK